MAAVTPITASFFQVSYFLFNKCHFSCGVLFVCLFLLICFLYFWLAPILAIAHRRDNSLDNLYLVCLCGLLKVIRSSAAVHFFVLLQTVLYMLQPLHYFFFWFIVHKIFQNFAICFFLQFSLEFAVIFLYSVLYRRMFRGTKGLNFSGLSKCMRYLYYVASLIHSGS